jgi:hypothetical protein
MGKTVNREVKFLIFHLTSQGLKRNAGKAFRAFPRYNQTGLFCSTQHSQSTDSIWKQISLKTEILRGDRSMIQILGNPQNKDCPARELERNVAIQHFKDFVAYQSPFHPLPINLTQHSTERIGQGFELKALLITSFAVQQSDDEREDLGSRDRLNVEGLKFQCLWHD